MTIEATRVRSLAERLFGPPLDGPGRLWPRWLLLRALGLIFFSAFYSLAFQIHGLIGQWGILPADEYLQSVSRAVPGVQRLWLAPTLLWLGAGDRALTMLVAAGIVCSLLLTANFSPRLMAALCTVLFLSCISALQDFSSYQSDGMLLEAGVLAAFLAPRGLRPGLGAIDPPSRASVFLLEWEWFRIYFGSGLVKLASGDQQWRTLTAMDHYYENGPLPSWPGWYVQQAPHAYHAFTALLTLVLELAVVWMMFLPRRYRVLLFLVVTPFQLGIIFTANYAFLNYLVLLLGVLLLDDRVLARLGLRTPAEQPAPVPAWRIWGAAGALTLIFYASVIAFASMFTRGIPAILSLPERALSPFRIANGYGLFAVMTESRYEIEFQGTRDGRTWVPYRFRYKPQDPRERPGVYAPYQPRFEWNLWFASLAPWRANPWVVLAQMRLLDGSPSVLALFRENPFPGKPPTAVRTVVWQYWFTDRASKRATGCWWNRRELGSFAGELRRRPEDGKMELVDQP